MATVRQSITALYEESQKSALEGAPMLAILQSETVNAGAGAAARDREIDQAPPTSASASAIAGRFDELRRLAEMEAAPTYGASAVRAGSTDASRSRSD